MKLDYDVIVVGGGPGGSTAARTCAQAGLKTLLVEKEKFPRYKPCAGCLSIKSAQLIGFDLQPVVENTVNSAKFTYALKDSFSIRSPQPIALMMMRDRFDQFLVRLGLLQDGPLSRGSRLAHQGDGKPSRRPGDHRASWGRLPGLGRWREAEGSYERALQLGPEDRERVKGKLEEARKKAREGKGD